MVLKELWHFYFKGKHNGCRFLYLNLEVACNQKEKVKYWDVAIIIEIFGIEILSHKRYGSFDGSFSLLNSSKFIKIESDTWVH